MALTRLQRHVCRLIADNRRARGESYVAGGVALNEALRATRISRDIDPFHDTDEALARSWDADRRLIESSGLSLVVIRERDSYVEAEVSDGDEAVLVQWLRDSAFRFFPLVADRELGLTLHPFDLATNKVLALVGRLEARDWIDVIGYHERIQPLGYLAWAACGKDPAFQPGRPDRGGRADRPLSAVRDRCALLRGRSSGREGPRRAVARDPGRGAPCGRSAPSRARRGMCDHGHR